MMFQPIPSGKLSHRPRIAHVFLVCIACLLDSTSASAQKPKEHAEDEKQPDGLGRFVSNTHGVLMLNPFTIEDRDGTLEIHSAGEQDVRYFTEVAFRFRGVWGAVEPKQKNSFVHAPWQSKRWFRHPDLEFRLGYAAKDKDASGATAVGAGDWFFELSAGYPCVELWPRDDRVHLTLNLPEFLIGAVTDRSAQDIHDSYAIGAALVAGIPVGETATEKGKSNTKKVELLGGFYYTIMETPELLDGREVRSSRGYPEFENDYCVLTMRADARIPFGKTGRIVIGGRYHIGFEDFNPWTVQIGYAASPETLGNIAEAAAGF